MLRNQNDNFNGYDQGRYPTPNQPIYVPPASQLDPKDERLLELSDRVGNLHSMYELTTEDNRRLESENSNLRRENKTLLERNKQLEQQTAKAWSVSELIDRIEQEVKNRKITKETK